MVEDSFRLLGQARATVTQEKALSYIYTNNTANLEAEAALPLIQPPFKALKVARRKTHSPFIGGPAWDWGKRVWLWLSALYRREILKSANGNPFLIKNLLCHGSRQRRLGHEEIRSLRRVEEGAYVNMGPLYIFSAGIFTLFKIFSIGTDNREFYIYFSALGFLVYLIFRVFRTFFLFRPQEYRT